MGLLVNPVSVRLVLQIVDLMWLQLVLQFIQSIT